MNGVYRFAAATIAAAFISLLSIPAITPSASAREVVAFNGGASPGTIVVRTKERRLYLVLGRGQAIRYPVGVGRAGWRWAGRAVIDGKYIKPDWAPPPEIARENPRLPKLIPGGSPHNPMGVAAMTLSGGDFRAARRNSDAPSLRRATLATRLAWPASRHRRRHGRRICRA
jgi:lipoprotein-anchoring transpeptidase ErfK/SrfK